LTRLYEKLRLSNPSFPSIFDVKDIEIIDGKQEKQLEQDVFFTTNEGMEMGSWVSATGKVATSISK
jgi:hypothetical protein